MNLVVLLILSLHLLIVSCVDADKVVLMDSDITRSFDYMQAEFSPPMKAMVETGFLYVAEPLDACKNLKNKPEQSRNGTSHFVLIVRGGCSFEYKIRNAQRSSFKAAIVHDNVDRDILLAMKGDPDGIKIQAVFVTKAAGEMLNKYSSLMEKEVMLVPSVDDSMWWAFATKALIVWFNMVALVAICFLIYRLCTTHNNTTSQFYGMSGRMVKALPSVTFTCVHGDNTTAVSCAICREDYTIGDKLRVLPCGHKFHVACIDSWLTSWRTFCPVCKRDARTSIDEPPASESTPLLRSSTATSSVVPIDSPLVGFSHHCLSSTRNVSPMSAGCMDSLNSPSYSTTSPSNAIP